MLNVFTHGAVASSARQLPRPGSDSARNLRHSICPRFETTHIAAACYVRYSHIAQSPHTAHLLAWRRQAVINRSGDGEGGPAGGPNQAGGQEVAVHWQLAGFDAWWHVHHGM